MFGFNDDFEKAMYELEEQRTLKKMSAYFGTYMTKETPILQTVSADDKWLMENGFSVN